MYGNQGMKQTGSYGGSSMYGSGQYGSGQSKQSSSQSFMSQAGSTNPGYVGYGSVRSQAGASGGYSTASVSAGGYSNVSSQATSANNAQQKPRQVISKPQQQQGQQQQPGNQSAANTYDTVILNAATSFLSQQGQQQKAPWQRQQKPQFRLQNERRQGPRNPQQLHYCEVCKISCAGPMTYKEHLEGQRHKKKAASQVTTSKEALPSGSYKCELCDITCTGLDAYDAHLKGAKHIKTIKLHQKLGKPIPDFKTPEQISAEEKKTANEGPKKVIQRPKSAVAPKINFVGGTSLTSTGSGNKDGESSATKIDAPIEDEDASMDAIDSGKEIVGEEYIEDLKSDVGKVIGYKCTLCDCRFNDMVARTAHVKGRRHRLNFKKKVQPSLKVDMKGSKFQNRLQRSGGGGDTRRAREQEVMWRARQQEQLRWEQELRMREEELRRWEEEEYLRKVEEDRYWTRPDHRNMHELEHYELERRARYFESQGGRGEGPNPLTPDDRLIMAKHNKIYPNEIELKQVQNVVGTTEKALKLVSDQIADEDQKAGQEGAEVVVKKEAEEKVKVKKEDGVEQDEKSELLKQEAKTMTTKSVPRTLKGVMRVGVLAKGLLLHESLDVELVVLCNDKPTLTLLRRVAAALPEKIKQVSDEVYDIEVDEKGGCITVSTQSDPKCSVEIKLTSPVMREEPGEEGKQDKNATSAEGQVLNKEKCLEALASLRHAKWFQARANGVQFCVIIIRIMRDLCSRVPAFQVLDGWAIELLVEKALSSGPSPAGAGEAFRRVLEVISSGIFLPGSCGLLDPCEKDKTDAVCDLSNQEREDLTAGAQHALRLHAFRQLHTVLDIEPLKPSPRGRGLVRPKRRRDDSRDSAGKIAGAKVQRKDDEKGEVAGTSAE
ncbi:zinc finger RNA-binding protein-like isoform X2 [Rhopilema esculentum]